MKSGGATTITLNTDKVKDIGTTDGKFDEKEMEAGLIDSTTKAVATDVNAETEVNYEGNVYKWKELREDIKKAAPSGGNLDPETLKNEIAKSQTKILSDLSSKTDAVQKLKSELKAAREAAGSDPAKQVEVIKADKALTEAKTELQKLIEQAKAAGLKAETNATLQRAQTNLGSEGEAADTSHNSTGEFKASTTTTTPTGPSGGISYGPQGENGMRASTGGGGYGNLLGSMESPFNASAYMNSMTMDGMLASAQESINNKTVEGKRLMMLFLYYAKRAESGDLGDMYQFMKFINYIIAKDKSKQNVQIGSKLIALQEESRRANDILTNADSSEKNQAAFAKLVSQTKSTQDTIATEQKLLAEISQEFAQVVETMSNSVKNLLDAWGRVQRNASSR